MEAEFKFTPQEVKVALVDYIKYHCNTSVEPHQYSISMTKSGVVLKSKKIHAPKSKKTRTQKTT